MPQSILLVDDEVKLTSALKRALYKEKYNIFTAGNASEALSIIEKKKIDLIISDENMPGLPGSGLLAMLRRKYPMIIRIMLTGQINTEAAYKAINEGDVYRFLVKPCNVLDLVITIRRALQYQSLLEKLQSLITQFESQTALMYLLENKRPGIISSLNPARISLDADDLDYDNLIQRIDMELEKSLKLLGGDLSPRPKVIEETTKSIENNAMPDANLQTSSAGTSVDFTDSRNQDDAPSTTQTKIQLPAFDIDAHAEFNELKPIMTRTDIKALLDNCGELKGLSPTVAQVLKMSRQPNCSIDSIAKIIKQDHAISLKILKLANSAAYTRGEPVDSVHKAVLRIGITQIQQAVLNIEIIDKISGDVKNDLLNLPQFWEHCISTGLIAAELAVALGEKKMSSDVAFTMGLLHDIGKLIYMDLLGDTYRQVLEISHRLELPLEQIESRMLLVNHADAMDRILHTWKFPAELINPVALHSLSLGNIRRVAPRMLEEVAILSLANKLSHALMLGMGGNPTIYPTDEFIPVLSLKPEIVQTIEEKIPGQTDDVKFALLANSNLQNWPQYINQVKDKLNCHFDPIYISAHPQTDSIRVFCDRLRSREGIGKPNIGIGYIKAPSERVMLTTRYKELEQKAEVSNLPLLLFSPKANIVLEDNFMKDRRFEVLPCPVTINRIIETINLLLTT